MPEEEEEAEKGKKSVHSSLPSSSLLDTFPASRFTVVVGRGIEIWIFARIKRRVGRREGIGPPGGKEPLGLGEDEGDGIGDDINFKGGAPSGGEGSYLDVNGLGGKWV